MTFRFWYVSFFVTYCNMSAQSLCHWSVVMIYEKTLCRLLSLLTYLQLQLINAIHCRLHFFCALINRAAGRVNWIDASAKWINALIKKHEWVCSSTLFLAMRVAFESVNLYGVSHITLQIEITGKKTTKKSFPTSFCDV